MKKKVINKERITKKGKMILASFVIGTTILNGVGVYASNDLSTNVSYSTNDSSVDYILNNIYQKQMSYLIPTMKRINEFFDSKDKNDIIKIGFPNVYEMSKNNLEIKYNLTSEELVNLIRENNNMISMLSIKPAGNGRDPEYGIISDSNSELGFRKKTKEDIELINKYTDLVEIDNDYSLISLFDYAKDKKLKNDYTLKKVK